MWIEIIDDLTLGHRFCLWGEEGSLYNLLIEPRPEYGNDNSFLHCAKDFLERINPSAIASILDHGGSVVPTQDLRVPDSGDSNRDGPDVACDVEALQGRHDDSLKHKG